MSVFAFGSGLLWAFQAAGEKAAEAAPAADPNQAPSLASLLMPMAIMMAAFYFLILLPESRKNKQRQALLSGMKKGDEVLTNGGIIGVVQNVKDDRVVLKVDDTRGVTIEFAKSAIGQILKSKGGEADAVPAPVK
jgi:preprotein translocase subunit YajC